jgi:hypothetical protein
LCKNLTWWIKMEVISGISIEKRFNNTYFLEIIWKKKFQNPEWCNTPLLCSSDHVLHLPITTHCDIHIRPSLPPPPQPCCLGDIMVSVIPIIPKVRRFKPGQGDGILRAIQICSIPSVARKKMTSKYEKNYFIRPHSSFPLPIPPACYQMTVLVGLPESSSGRIRSLPLLASYHHGSVCSYITWGDEH